MKNFNIIILALFLIGFGTISSCNKEVAEQQNNEPEFIKNFGATTERDFLIEVIDEDGRPLANTNIQIGDFSGKTDLNGILLKKGARVYQKYAFIKASKSGYITGGRSLIPGTGTNKVTIQLMQGNLAGTVISGKNGIVTLSNGTKVEFDGAFEDANGNPYSGDVKVYMKLLSTSDKDIGTKMPGMLYGKREDESESILETFGMVSVELFGSSEQAIQPAKGHKAKISIPIDASQTSSAPSSIPLWHFDEKYGYWIEEGSASRVGNDYIGEVSHFSWWNCDISVARVTIHLNIKDLLENPLPNINFKILRINTARAAFGITDDMGEFSGFVPQNEVLELKVMNLCGEEVYAEKIGPYTEETILPDIKINDKSIIFKGNLKNCKGEAVKDGYIEVKTAGNRPKYFSIVNGEINTRILSCKIGEYEILGFDNTSLLTTGIFAGMLSEPVTNFGTLNACDSSDEYISYSVDGKPPKILKSLIECYDKIDGFEISAKYGLDYFKAGSSTNAKINGKYGLIDIFFHASDFKISPAQMNVISYLNYGKSKGDFVDIEFSGTFADLDDITHIQSLKGTIHVKRDN